MDYEKAYKEALERARKLDTREMPIDPTHSIQEQIFPKLHESEDERISKECIELIASIRTSSDSYYGFKENERKTRCIKWLEKQCEKKLVEWSEKDEKMLKRVIESISISRSSCEEDDDIKDMYDEEINWLKSLKPQPHWIPSDFEIESLNIAIGNQICQDIKKYLIQLLDELKTLRDYK